MKLHIPAMRRRRDRLSRIQHAQLVALALTAAACQVEQTPPTDARQLGLSAVEGPLLGGHQAGPARGREPALNPFDGETHAVADGERFYGWFNCAGCHGAVGGGAMGPPLADSDWIYGGSPDHILDSILKGRPNGMPAYAGMLDANVAWKLVAYVETLGAVYRNNADSDAAPLQATQDAGKGSQADAAE